MDEGELFIRDAATKRGIDPDTALTVARMEGGVDAPGLIGKFETGWSFWQYQLHYGGAEYPQYGTVAGMGNGFTKLTGWQPGDPRAWKDSVRYALNRAKLGGWGPWYGAKKAGITSFDGINRDYPWNASSETWDYEAGSTPMPKLTYNPDAPVDIQDNDWSCSEQSAQWLLRAINRNPGDAWIRDQLLTNGLVTKEDGLMDASGGSLAAWLQREYGAEMGLRFTNKNGATWEDIAAIAGKQPMMLGGRSWNHWTGVRRMTDAGLELANPAPNWQSVGTVLDRAEWEQWGSWSYVTVADGSTPVPAPVPPPVPSPVDPKDVRIAELEAALAAEQEKVHGLITALAVVGDDRADDLQRQVDAIRAIREQFLGKRPA